MRPPIHFSRLLIPGIGVGIALVGSMAWLRENARSHALAAHSPGNPPSSQAGFRITYLDPQAGRPSPFRTSCIDCHPHPDTLPRDRWNSLNQRAPLSQSGWAAEAGVVPQCGACHPAPAPASLSQTNWVEAIERMGPIRADRGIPAWTPDQRSDLLHYYLTFSSNRPPALAADPPLERELLGFRLSPEPFGNPKTPDSRVHPILGQIQITDLDRDGLADVLVCDTEGSRVQWIHRASSGSPWVEETLAAIPHPTRCHPWTNEITGEVDLIVAAQTRIDPTEDPVGRVVHLKHNPHRPFSSHTLLEGLPRLADVMPGDFNGDGRTDFLIAGFGFLRNGEVGWLENVGNSTWRYQPIVVRTGAIHVLPADLNGDGRLDFVALFAQEHERISAFINQGQGTFREHVLFEAGTPAYGSSGISLVDMDGDGDLDILYTNGDSMDLPTRLPRPFHGVQWLENQGNLRFAWHEIRRIYGAYSAVAVDRRANGHPDVVVGSLFNDWEDPTRASLVWLENDGRQQFTAHTLAHTPIQLISLAVGSLEQDGTFDILATGMHGFPPYDRMARISRWHGVPHAPGLQRKGR